MSIRVKLLLNVSFWVEYFSFNSGFSALLFSTFFGLIAPFGPRTEAGRLPPSSTIALRVRRLTAFSPLLQELRSLLRTSIIE